ncbi:MAG: hypothetical protein K2J15_01390 [Muribaculaceae bacterium]|nr:hypothetical protein [Muribaculaceae bacterium]
MKCDESFGYGTARCDTYDICIRINDPRLSGGIIKSMSVPLPENKGCRIKQVAEIWVTSSLPEGDLGPHNCVEYLEVKTEGESIDCEFPKEIVIPEDGLYIGYSVTVEEIPAGNRQYPISVVSGSTPGSLYYRTSQYRRWDETFSRMEFMSAMKVQICACLPKYAVSFHLPENLRVKAGEDAEIPVNYQNTGTETIRSIEYQLTVDGSVERGDIFMDEEEYSGWGMERPAVIMFKVPESCGNHTLEFKVININGKYETGVSDEVAITKLRVLPFIPVFRPLIEEYTGLWCGNCPSGWVAIEELIEMYGEDFVYATYHINDVLTSHVQLPVKPSSVPAASINRGRISGIGDLYDNLSVQIAQPTDTDLKVFLNWTDESQSELKATATATFMENVENENYELELLLVSDRLSDPAWGQTNYYAGQIGKTGKYWEIFTKGSTTVFGLEYNSVVVTSLKQAQLTGKIPGNIKEFESYCVEGTFKLSNGISAKGVPLTKNKDSLRVIAIMTDKKANTFVNAATSDHSSGAGAGNEYGYTDPCSHSITVDHEIYFDLSGRAVEIIEVGRPYIRVIIRNDGTVNSEKIFSGYTRRT